MLLCGTFPQQKQQQQEGHNYILFLISTGTIKLTRRLVESQRLASSSLESLEIEVSCNTLLGWASLSRTQLPSPFRYSHKYPGLNLYVDTSSTKHTTHLHILDFSMFDILLPFTPLSGFEKLSSHPRLFAQTFFTTVPVITRTTILQTRRFYINTHTPQRSHSLFLIYDTLIN